MIPDWKLERYRLGELSPEDQATVAKAIADDEGVRHRIAALEESDRAIRAAYPTLPQRRSAAPVEAPSRPPRLWLLVPVMVAAGLGAFVLMNGISKPVGEDVLRPKGGDPSLHIYRLAAAHETERLQDGAHVKPHDVVQVAFDLQSAPHFVIASVDGAGHTTLHWPTDGGSTAAPQGFKQLPESFELDEAPAFERFFLVTSDQPLSPRAVLDAAQRAGRTGTPSLPGQVAIRSVLLDKESP